MTSVPSRAMLIYRRAFGRHDGERFGEFLADVKSGKKTIKAGTLFPYDIVEKLMHGEENDVLEEQWKALPNYIEGDNNILGYGRCFRFNERPSLWRLPLVLPFISQSAIRALTTICL